MKDNCFTILCWLLPYTNRNQPCPWAFCKGSNCFLLKPWGEGFLGRLLRWSAVGSGVESHVPWAQGSSSHCSEKSSICPWVRNSLLLLRLPLSTYLTSGLTSSRKFSWMQMSFMPVIHTIFSFMTLITDCKDICMHETAHLISFSPMSGGSTGHGSCQVYSQSTQFVLWMGVWTGGRTGECLFPFSFLNAATCSSP